MHSFQDLFTKSLRGIPNVLTGLDNLRLQIKRFDLETKVSQMESKQTGNRVLAMDRATSEWLASVLAFDYS